MNSKELLTQVGTLLVVISFLKNKNKLAITAATQLGGDVQVLVAAEDASAAAAEVAGIAGVSAVLAASGAQYKGGIAENMTPLVMAAQSQTGATQIGLFHLFVNFEALRTLIFFFLSISQKK